LGSVRQAGLCNSFIGNADRFAPRTATSIRSRESADDYDVISCYRTPHGLLWIGTKTKGVPKWNPRPGLSGISWALTLRATAISAFAEDAKNPVAWTFGAA